MVPISSFPLRCGIVFGNSKDEIKNLENHYLIDVKMGNTLAFVGAVSGIPDGDGITFYTFNSTEELVYMSYVYHITFYKGSSSVLESHRKINNIRKTLLEGMTKKYGSPQYKEDSLHNISCGSEYKDLVKSALRYENSHYHYGSESNSDNLQAWIIPEQNGYIIIQLHRRTEEDKLRDEMTDVVELGYQFISSEEYHKIMEAQQEKDGLTRIELTKKEEAFLNDL